jgi:hypothetical protein
MKKLKRLILFVCFIFAGNSAALNLEGIWKSDLESTVEFNSANAKLEKRQEEFLLDLLGKLTITYKNGVAYLSMPSTKVTVNGELKDFEGYESTQSYEILAQDKDTIIVEFTGDKDEKDLSLLKFEGEDKYWVYLPNSSSQWSQLHIREYFVREK